jgi:hypothetical protein
MGAGAHVFSDEEPYDEGLRQSEYDLLQSHDTQRALAYEYVGLPFEV